ncbi:helix-turn-helix transcriptional regulator [Leptolyngbya sp. NK1-12]|uniref:Helix-turn-helix transcriptional regulator n=1 Tax=Leptolyngbya sp. NK1-12 TaxID=2547451 RepID=A0AA96WJN3_9CYAN|nr:helix-turn-helix transcriptional regulator [Leptolyngbya sp. NK1-12]
MTLDDLAECTGVSRAMLSDIERGTKNPTIKVVCQIAEVFGYTVSQLLGEDDRDERTVVVIRREERHVLVEPQTGVERHLLSPGFVQRGLEVIWYVVPPGQTGSFPAHRHNTMEHITVIKGCLKYAVGDIEGILEEGDSIFFAADVTHDFYNPGTESSHFFLVIDSTAVG